jgi:hypothetical protein
MGHAKTVAEGFLAVVSIIFLLVTAVWLPLYVNWWVSLSAFIFLAVPFSLNCLYKMRRFHQKTDASPDDKRVKNVLMSLQGLGFGGWFLDVMSTSFVVDMNRSGIELNILGWPTAALGGLAYYIPITFVVYYLLFKANCKESFYSVIVITLVISVMGARNLGSGLYNLSVLGELTSLTAQVQIVGTWLGVSAILAACNLAALMKARKTQLMPLNPHSATALGLSMSSSNAVEQKA